MRATIITGILLALPINIANAQERSSKPWWNPFAKETTDTMPSATGVQQSAFFESQAPKSSGFKMPKLRLPSLPGFGKKTDKPSGPSAFSRMTESSKKMWNSTVDFINPFDKKSEPKASMGYQPQYSQTQKKSNGWKWPWSGSDSKIEEPTNVSEFLRQPRPQF